MPTIKTVAAAIAVGGVLFAAGCGSSLIERLELKLAAPSPMRHGHLRLRLRRDDRPGRGVPRRRGQLNVITLPANWANYGTIMKDFTAKYGIKINDANPDGSSQDEINAMQQLKGQSRAPDVLDMGTAFAIKADQQACSPRTR